MDEDKISKPEDQLIRNWIKRHYGVRVPQFDLWQLTIDEAVKRLKGISSSLSNITKEDVEKAARRTIVERKKS
jgi:hypothetical protein